MSLTKILHEGLTSTEIHGFKIVGPKRSNMFPPAGRDMLWDILGKPDLMLTDRTTRIHTGTSDRGTRDVYSIGKILKANMNTTTGFFVFPNKQEAVFYLRDNDNEERTIIDVSIPARTQYRIGLCNRLIIYLVAELKVIS